MVRDMLSFTLRHLLLFLSCGILSSCMADRLAFWQKDALHKKYTVTGIDDNPDVREYVTSVLDDRFANFKVEEGDEASLEYHEEIVRRDLIKAMHAKGFYDASVIFNEGEEAGAAYDILAGSQATIEKITITPNTYKADLEKIGLNAGTPLIASDVLYAQKMMRKNLQNQSCAFDLSVSHRAFLNKDTNAAEIQFMVREGKPATFGEITFTGQEDVRESYLKKLLTLKQGDCFRHDQIETMRDSILATGLFSRVEVILPETGSKGGAIPVTFALKERAQRTIKGGLSYYTDDGAGAIAGWEHRNFLGAGEKVNIDLNLSLLEQSLTAKFNKPFFMRKDQSLILKAGINRKDTDAFEEIAIDTGFQFSRKLNKRLTANLGADYKITKIKENNEETRTFGLLSPNTSFKYDSRDNTLDPQKGWLLTGSAKAFIDSFGESSPFTKSEFGAQTYLKAHNRVILAARTKLGSIAGTQTDDIPATERFFAGGGGSVRGFAHQEIGPKEPDGDPAGGRSLFEGSVETRLKFTDTLGMVAFVDAGHVGDKVFPTFDRLSVGAGLGARYYTDFGPLRVDVAVPVAGKDDADAAFQVYISIGQAF